jgi:hypothetical protein
MTIRAAYAPSVTQFDVEYGSNATDNIVRGDFSGLALGQVTSRSYTSRAFGSGWALARNFLAMNVAWFAYYQREHSVITSRFKGDQQYSSQMLTARELRGQYGTVELGKAAKYWRLKKEPCDHGRGP